MERWVSAAKRAAFGQPGLLVDMQKVSAKFQLWFANIVSDNFHDITFFALCGPGMRLLRC